MDTPEEPSEGDEPSAEEIAQMRSATPIYELPAFDTGQYEDSEFLMREGDAVLNVRIAELGTVSIMFHRVRWHQFTALPNCTSALIGDAYFRLVEVESPAVAAFIAADSSTRKAFSELHHYRIFIDETGCHEVFAESCGAA